MTFMDNKESHELCQTAVYCIEDLRQTFKNWNFGNDQNASCFETRTTDMAANINSVEWIHDAEITHTSQMIKLTVEKYYKSS